MNNLVAEAIFDDEIVDAQKRRRAHGKLHHASIPSAIRIG